MTKNEGGGGGGGQKKKNFEENRQNRPFVRGNELKKRKNLRISYALVWQLAEISDSKSLRYFENAEF